MTIYARVNDADYDGEAVIEVVDYYAGGSAVPPWEEWGLCNLAGPFATWKEARSALEAEAASDNRIGIYYMPDRDCPNFD